MLRLQRYDGGAELDAGRARAHQRDGQQGVKVVGRVRNPGGVHARVLGPLDIGKHPGDLARGIAALGADHYSETHVSSLLDWDCRSECSYPSNDNVLAKKENANTARLTRLNAGRLREDQWGGAMPGTESRHAGQPASHPQQRPSPAMPTRSH